MILAPIDITCPEYLAYLEADERCKNAPGFEDKSYHYSHSHWSNPEPLLHVAYRVARAEAWSKIPGVVVYIGI